MSLEDTFLATRIGRGSTYRCQTGYHDYDSNHFCIHCGTQEFPVEPKVSRTTLIDNPDELARWYRLDRDEFTVRLLRDLNLEGRLVGDRLIIYEDVSRAQIEKVLADWIFSD